MSGKTEIVDNQRNDFTLKVWVKKTQDGCGSTPLLTNNKLKWELLKEMKPEIGSRIELKRPNPSEYYQLRIAFYYDNNLKGSSPGNLAKFQIFDKGDEGTEFLPIIHIIEKDGGIFLSDEYTKVNPESPRYRYITDNGIWNHFAKDAETFNSSVERIRENWEKGYYHLNIAKEYADLYARLAKESFLYKDPHSDGGHGEAVSPFLFHSESILKKAIDNEKIAKTISNYRWRFLLVDDRVNRDKKDGKGVLSSSKPEIKLTKADILVQRLKDLELSCDCIIIPDGNDSTIELDGISCSETVQIVCVETVGQALELLKRTKFDIILLDYLLKGEYGYELLNKVKAAYNDPEEFKIHFGPRKKLFFMFISAFTTAVNERLTLEGLSVDEDYWLIGEGACPTNTPELFKYRLLHLMQRRLKKTGIEDLSLSNILKTVKNVYHASEQKNLVRLVRKNAYEAYSKVLGFHYDFFLMQSEDKDESRLVDSFLKTNVHMGAMLEHLLQLIHLTAFGTVRQWPEIWEEYQYFMRAVNISSDSDESNELSEIAMSIENYIIELKSE